MEEALIEAGLSRNEASVYLHLLKKGSSTTGKIIAETGLANSRVYDALHRLREKGLVTTATRREGTWYTAAEPETLLTTIEEKRSHIAALVPKLTTLRKSAPPEAPTTATIYEGHSGFRTAFQKVIDETPEGGTIRIIGFSKQLHADDSLRTFITNMNLRSAAKKQKLRMLLDETTKQSQALERSKETLTTIRYLEPGVISPAAIDITNEAVYQFVWDVKPYVIVIRNKAIVASYQSYFDALWKNAKSS